MGICGFRADSFDFGLLDGGELSRIASFLERVEEGATVEGLCAEWGSVLESLETAGLVSCQGAAVFLESKGKAFLKACRTLPLQSNPG
jgi:hypothetical protein